MSGEMEALRDQMDELLEALVRAVNGAPHWRREAQQVIIAATRERPASADAT